MATANLIQFRRKVDGDQTLQGELRKNGVTANAAGVVALGKKYGFEFTEGEVRELFNSVELSEFELEMVAGGANSNTHAIDKKEC